MKLSGLIDRVNATDEEVVITKKRSSGRCVGQFG